MATRQYIGARYVIKVYENSQTAGSAEWEANTSYEPLTMVTYQNSSYLSKKAVPASIGNPASNGGYWAVTGAYNGQIAQLQSDVQNLSDTLTDVATYVNNDKIGSKKNETAIFFGDSYLSGTGSTGNNKGIFYYLKDLFKNAYKYSGSGTGFIDYDGGHSADTFLTQLNTAINDSAFDNDDITEIYIVGAFGESRAFVSASRTSSTYINNETTAIATFATNARTAFPNLKRIYYINAESHKYNACSGGGITTYFYDTFNAPTLIERIFNTNNIINLGWVGYYIAYVTAMFSSDGYHPNDAGYVALTNAIIRKLQGSLEVPLFVQTDTLDIGSFTGINNCYLQYISQFGKDPKFIIRFITMQAGTLNIGTTAVKIPFPSTMQVPPFELDVIGRAYSMVAVHNGKAYSFIARIYIDSSGMGIELNSTNAITDTVPYGVCACGLVID